MIWRLSVTLSLKHISLFPFSVAFQVIIQNMLHIRAAFLSFFSVIDVVVAVLNRGVARQYHIFCRDPTSWLLAALTCCSFEWRVSGWTGSILYTMSNPFQELWISALWRREAVTYHAAVFLTQPASSIIQPGVLQPRLRPKWEAPGLVERRINLLLPWTLSHMRFWLF